MKHLVFMLEEPSIGEVLKEVVPKIIPPTVTFQLVPHEGKNDLEKSLPRKLRAWRTPHVQFVVLRDKDSAECLAVKKRLVDICRQAGRSDCLIRIVCPHLEAWFLGDLAAIETALSLRGLKEKQRKRKYQNPDALANAEQELRKLAPSYQKLGGARAIAPHLSLQSNLSKSFQNFVLGLKKLLASEINFS